MYNNQIPTLASCSFDEIVDAAVPEQVQFMQLLVNFFLLVFRVWYDLCYSYVNEDKEVTRKIVQHAEKRGVKALFITVDAPQLGRREKVKGAFFI
jgi:L-lactate dehydrogenase (cytochrome)